MFSIKSYTDEINKQLRSRIVTVTFIDGTEEQTETFRFQVGTADLVVKKVVKQYLDEINQPFQPITGDITDVPADPTPTPPTQAELDFQAWVKDRADLKKLKDLVAEGILAEGTTQQTTLQAKVNTGWKNAYFNQI